MIDSKDRSGWFGASDTSRILGKFDTKTFSDFWLEKLGLISNTYTNDSLLAGTYYEHKILDSLGFPVEKDAQILIPDLRLRVNLDGNTEDTIYEVKTHREDKKFSAPIQYKRQVWVQMYASGFRKAFIVAYGLENDDYQNFFHEINKDRLELCPVEYNGEFIEQTYLPRLRYLKCCLDKGSFPTEEEFKGGVEMC